jgi:hypothetical protein
MQSLQERMTRLASRSPFQEREGASNPSVNRRGATRRHRGGLAREFNEGDAERTLPQNQTRLRSLWSHRFQYGDEEPTVHGQASQVASCEIGSIWAGAQMPIFFDGV